MAKPRVSRARHSKEVALTGGPWAGQNAVLPRQNEYDPWSLPIRVGAHAGRYNLNTGAWVALEQHGENA